MRGAIAAAIVRRIAVAAIETIGKTVLDMQLRVDGE
jgi:hypothetical protein